MIQAYTNDQTLFTRENFTFKCHEPLPIPTDEIDVDKFFGRWDCLIQSAFDGLPIFIRDSIEVKALSKLLGNVQFKNTAQKFGSVVPNGALAVHLGASVSPVL